MAKKTPKLKQVKGTLKCLNCKIGWLHSVPNSFDYDDIDSSNKLVVLLPPKYRCLHCGAEYLLEE